MIHGRNETKIQATLTELQRLTNNNKLHGFKADLSLLSEVRQMASDVDARFPVLHGLLNNAGTFDGNYTGQRQDTQEGNEYSLAVNVLAPFLLTSLLLCNIQASGAGRVIITSSCSSGCADKLQDLQLRKEPGSWSKYTAYSLSKLCDALMIEEMNTRFGNAPYLCFHTMDPGMVDTKMLRAGWFSGGSSVRTATASFQMLTEDRFQLKSGLNLGGGTYRNNEAKQKLWEDLVSLTDAEWPSNRGMLL